MTGMRHDEHLLLEAGELILITASRVSGEAHETALPFVYEDGVVYLLAHAGEEAEWYRDLEKDRGVVLRLKRRGFRGRATLLDVRHRPKVAARIAALFKRKYGTAAFEEWDETEQMPVAIDVQF